MLLLSPVAVCLAACGRAPAPAATVRLVDLLDSLTVESSAVPPVRSVELPLSESGLWRIETDPGLTASRNGGGVTLRLLPGARRGVAVLGRRRALDVRGDPTSLEVHLRATGPRPLSVSVALGARLRRLDPEAVSLAAGRREVAPSEDPVWFSFPLASTQTRARLGRRPPGLVVEVSGRPGGAVEISSLRLGIGSLMPPDPRARWVVLGGTGRPAIVSRCGERLRFSVRVPRRAWLDLAVGTLERVPVRFRVFAKTGRGSEREIWQRTVSKPGRWLEARIDLAALAGQAIDLVLLADSTADGKTAFWGGPALYAPPPAPAAGGQPARPRGVILVIADTLRRDHLEAYGYARATAPVLDRLSRQGVLFEDAISQGSWTKVSVTTILSGLYPTSHGVAGIHDLLPEAATTLAEVFHDAGYATWGASSVWFTGKASNLQQGFDVLHERGSVRLPRGVAASKTARVLVDRLLPWLEAHRGTRFFVLLHVLDPHSPYQPYPPYDGLWADMRGWRAFRREARRVKQHIARPDLRRRGLASRRELEAAGIDPRRYVAFEEALYDGSIRAMDAELGRLVESLAALGLGQDTLVALVSDHGEEFLDHGRSWHGETVYGEITDVPMILWWPRGLPAGRTVREAVGSIDLAPTLLELAGLPVPSSYQGQSLVPLIRRGAGEPARGERRRPVVSELWYRTPEGGDRPPWERDRFALLDGRWRLIHNAGPGAEAAEYELYDHRTDPLEHHNVAEERPELVARLAAELEAWHRWAESQRLAPESSTQPLSRETLQELRSLGYLELTSRDAVD